MELLPDEVLLIVLEELKDAADILACRLVCKRLAALALHPAVWRGFEVCHSKLYCSCPVLRLAPCLHMISVCLPAEGCRCLPWACASTRSAAARLLIGVEGASHNGLAAAIISRQEALGRLVEVEIDVGFVVATDVSMLLGMLASTSRLKRLCVCVNNVEEDQPPTTPNPFLGSTVVAPSLVEFGCTLYASTEPFVQFILSQHAATIEEVDLGDFASGSSFASIVPLLAGVTNLSRLAACYLPGMEALAACKSLSVLHLNVHTGSTNDQAVLAKLAQLLRRAEQLRELSLEYEPAVRGLADFGAYLVLALASSGRSRVETLRIIGFGSSSDGVENPPLLRLLVRALPSMPALRCLVLENDAKRPDGLLLAIRPDLAPALRRVEVRLLELEYCAHSWLHGDTVKTVLAANPSLHIKLSCLRLVCGRDKRCQACELGCHGELRGDRNTHFYVYSHDPWMSVRRTITVKTRASPGSISFYELLGIVL